MGNHPLQLDNTIVMLSDKVHHVVNLKSLVNITSKGHIVRDQYNTTVGNEQRDLTEGQSYVTCSALRYPIRGMRGRGMTGGQEELWSQRMTRWKPRKSCGIKSGGEVQHIPTRYIYDIGY